jgi:hypothetical protein
VIPRDPSNLIRVMPAKGREAPVARGPPPVGTVRRHLGAIAMNKPTGKLDHAAVPTGERPGSRKVHQAGVA